MDRVDAFDCALDRIARSSSLGELSRDTTRLIKDLLGARHLVLIEFDDAGAIQAEAGDTEELESSQYFEHIAADDPVTAVVGRMNPDLFNTDRHMTEQWRREMGALCADYYRRHELGRVLCARVGRSDFYCRDERGLLRALPGGLMMAVFRSERDEAFGQAEERLMRRLVPALAALDNGVRSQRLMTRLALLEATLDVLEPRPRLALDSHGRVLWGARSTLNLLGAMAPGAPRGVPVELAAAARALIARGDFEGQPSVILRGPCARAAPMLAVLRLARSPQGGTMVIVELGGEPAALLAARHGLTPAETQVLVMLGEGLSNAQIARKLFVSLATVKTHVHRLLGKIGVSSRLEAAVLVQRSMAGRH